MKCKLNEAGVLYEAGLITPIPDQQHDKHRENKN